MEKAVNNFALRHTN